MPQGQWGAKRERRYSDIETGRKPAKAQLEQALKR